MPPSKQGPAAICYVELPAPDPELAATFYRSVFGWNVERSTLAEQAYWTFTTGDDQLSGGFDARLPVTPGGPLLYLKVEDISGALRAVERAGGRVVEGRKAVGGDHGFFGLFEDVSGHRCGLWSPR